MKAYQLFRQRFYLSVTAWEVINNDATIFITKKKPSFAGMINLILEMYMDNSDAAIENAVLRRRNYLGEQLSDYSDEEEKEKVVNILTAKYIEELREKIASYPCDINKSSSLTEDNYEIAQKWQDKYSCYGNSVAKFFKAVIEEYARKPYYEREGIILRKTIDELESCIEKHQLIRLTLKDGRQYDVRPYKICHDSDYNYHYLTGMSKKTGTDNVEKATPFRISGIKSIRRMHEPSGRIKKIEAVEIEQKLQNSGAQFLLDEQESIVVRLTPKGKKDYETQLHLRPRFIEREQVQDGSWKYTFNCTQRQAEYYFYKFGSDAIIEQPPKLRDKFMCRYEAALTVYKNNT